MQVSAQFEKLWESKPIVWVTNDWSSVVPQTFGALQYKWGFDKIGIATSCLAKDYI